VVAKEEEALAQGKKPKNPLTKNSDFQNLMTKFNELKAQGPSPHPKMEKLRDILVTYFGARMKDPTDPEPDKPDDTRVMVFSSYRAVVDEIIQELNQNQPLIRAAAFIGQSSDKKGRKGLKQKEQIEVRASLYPTRKGANSGFSSSNGFKRENSMFWLPPPSVKKGWTSVKLTLRFATIPTRLPLEWWLPFPI
jgi:ERCC4-related helicase